ncbi:MAG: division/cell wall cluster transcriptional repressor MraZ [Lachnospiraceae bacterium]|nr:division/cell wall cluster transcriptional repressor MraZ [Lachnospiraceae bacterium]
MSFMAEYQNNMDSKGRVILPVKFRESIGETFIIVKGIKDCLLIYPMDEWQKFAEKLDRLDMNKANHRAYKRHFLGSSVETELDSLERLTIPQNLRKFAELEKELVFLGQGSYIEVWAKNKLEEVTAEYDIEAIAEDIGEF